jgi:hypothetical protein
VLWNNRQQLPLTADYQETFELSILQEFYGKEITAHRMYLSQNEEECGYKTTERLPISSGKGRNFERKL